MQIQVQTDTETHIYFLGGHFSNWCPSKFTERLAGAQLNWHNVEQYMMAAKAYTFLDNDILQKILKEPNPRDVKALGRKVHNFDSNTWNNVSRNFVYNACYAKFTQNESFQNYITSTFPKIIVEGADYDKIWGVGVSYLDKKILNEKNWEGTNWLGQVLMKVRKDIMNNEDNRHTNINWDNEPNK